MKKISLLLVIFGLSLQFNSFAQSEEEAIKTTVNHYLQGLSSGDTAQLNRAFHPSAVLKTFNTGTGKIQDFPVKTFIARTPTGGVKASTKIISMAYAGISASANVEISFDDFKYIDLLSLLKVQDEWKIVARVFSRVDKTVELKSNAMNTTAKAISPTTPAKKASSANAKPKKDDGW